MYGILKFFVEITVKKGVARLKMVHALACETDQADKRAIEFTGMNKHLPIVRITWTAEPRDISLPLR